MLQSGTGSEKLTLRLMIIFFGLVYSGQNIIWSGQGKAIKYTVFLSRSGQKITGHYKVRVVMPCRSLPELVCGGKQGKFRAFDLHDRRI